jgi:hypothetical protein
MICFTTAMKRFISNPGMILISVQIAQFYCISLQLQSSITHTLPHLGEACNLEYSTSTYWNIWEVSAIIKNTVFVNFNTLDNINLLSFVLKI